MWNSATFNNLANRLYICLPQFHKSTKYLSTSQVSWTSAGTLSSFNISFLTLLGLTERIMFHKETSGNGTLTVSDQELDH